MAGTANAVDFKWFTYVDDQGGNWSVRAEKDWGASGASGLGAFNAAYKAFPTGMFYRTRKVILQDLVSGRKTKRVLGTAAATAGVPGATVVTVARGQVGSYTLTSLGVQGERLPKTSMIANHIEPVTT